MKPLEAPVLGADAAAAAAGGGGGDPARSRVDTVLDRLGLSYDDLASHGVAWSSLKAEAARALAYGGRYCEPLASLWSRTDAALDLAEAEVPSSIEDAARVDAVDEKLSVAFCSKLDSSGLTPTPLSRGTDSGYVPRLPLSMYWTTAITIDTFPPAHFHAQLRQTLDQMRAGKLAPMIAF